MATIFFVKGLIEKQKQRTPEVFAIAGLEGRTIGSKSLFSFGSGFTLIINRQMLSSAIKQKATSVPA
jgi:hypothetical protein